MLLDQVIVRRHKTWFLPPGAPSPKTFACCFLISVAHFKIFPTFSFNSLIACFNPILCVLLDVAFTPIGALIIVENVGLTVD